MKFIRMIGCVCTIFICLHHASAQNSVGIGTQTPNSNAVLELVSPGNDQGLLVPRLTTQQRTAETFTSRLTNAENGLMVFDTDEGKFYFWVASQWQSVSNNQSLAAGLGINIINGTISNTGDLDTTNEIQDLVLQGNQLRVTNNTNATNIDLSVYLDNTDEQVAAEVAFTPMGGLSATDVQGAIEQLDATLAAQPAGDMLQALYDADGDTIVDISAFALDAAKVNGLMVEMAVPAGAVFTDEQTAVEVAYDNTQFGLAAVNVQDALDELSDNLDLVIASDLDQDPTNEIQDLFFENNSLTITNNPAATEIDLSVYLDNTDNQTAVEVNVAAGAGTLSSTNVQDALAELDGKVNSSGDMLKSIYDTDNNNVVDISENAQLVNNLSVETAVPAGAVFTDSQNAEQVAFNPQAGISATTVQTAVVEVKGLLDAVPGGNMLKSVYDTNDNGIVDNAALVNGLSVQTAVPAGAVFTDNQTAAQVTVGAGAGTLSSTNVQAALAELDGKVNSSGTGDMLKSMYDPQTLEADAFNLANHTGKISSAQINDNAVTTTAIANGAVTSIKIAPKAVQAGAIDDLAVANNQIALDAVTSNRIQDGTIMNTDINASAAIAGTKINPEFGALNISTTGSVTANTFLGNGAGLTALSASNLTAGTVSVARGGTGAGTAAAARTNLGLGTAATLNVGIAANNVVQLVVGGALPAVSGANLTNLPIPTGINTGQLADGAVTTAKIANEAVTNANILEISPTKISTVGAMANNVLKFNGSTWVPAVDEVNDADADPMNEIQDLSLTGSILTITGNASPAEIDLSSFNSDNQTAAQVSVTPTGNLAATDVQAGLGELQTDVDNINTDLSSIQSTLTMKVDESANPNAGDIGGSFVSGLTIEDGAITSAKIANGTITDIDISGAAAIAGSKISPDFGTQNITTTGSVTANTISGNGTGMTALSASNLTIGTVSIARGGTGAGTAVDARTNLGLGTAATLNVGTVANNVVQLVAGGALPGVSGANLTNLPIPTGINTGQLTDGAVNSAKIADGTILNTDINNSAAIAGTKINPDFGAQNMSTTGDIGAANGTFTGTVTAGSFSGDGSTLSNLPFTSNWTENTGDVYRATGNVGIGTSNPTVPLDVIGITKTSVGMGVGPILGGTPGLIAGAGRYLTVATIDSYSTTAPASIEIFGASTNATDIVSRLDFGFINAGPSPWLASRIASNRGGSMFFYTGGPNERMTISSTGDLGIGTSTPTQRLDVNGNIIIPTNNEYMYAAPKTKYFSLSASDFNLTINDFNSNMKMGSSGSGNYRYVVGGTAGLVATFWAPLHLPDGAVITSVDFYIWDSDLAYDVNGVLVRMNLGGSGFTDVVSTTLSSGANNVVATQTATTSTNVNNATNAFILKFNTGQASEDLRIYGARVTYTVSKSD